MLLPAHQTNFSVVGLAGGPAFSFDFEGAALFDFRRVRILTLGLYPSLKIFFNLAHKSFIHTNPLHQRRLKNPAESCSNGAELYGAQTTIRRKRRPSKHPKRELHVPISNRHSDD
jgi:hypothetical protein